MSIAKQTELVLEASKCSIISTKEKFFVFRFNENTIFLLAQGERAFLQHADQNGRNPVANVGPVQCLPGEFILRGIRGSVLVESDTSCQIGIVTPEVPSTCIV